MWSVRIWLLFLFVCVFCTSSSSSARFFTKEQRTWKHAKTQAVCRVKIILYLCPKFSTIRDVLIHWHVDLKPICVLFSCQTVRLYLCQSLHVVHQQYLHFSPVFSCWIFERHWVAHNPATHIQWELRPPAAAPGILQFHSADSEIQMPCFVWWLHN